MNAYIEKKEYNIGKSFPLIDYVDLLDSESPHFTYNRFNEYENNGLELSILNDLNEVTYWETQFPIKKYVSIKQEYFNLQNKKIEYTYRKFVGNIVSSVDADRNQSISLPVIQDLNRIGISDGICNLIYQPISSIVGDNENKLKVKEISPSGTEIKITCPISSIEPDFDGFISDKYKVKYYIPTITTLINTLGIYTYYNDVKDDDRFTRLLHQYALKNKVDGLFLFVDILNGYSTGKNKSNGLPANKSMVGAIYLIEHFLYSNYDIRMSLSDIESKCIEIINECIDIVTNEISAYGDSDYIKSIFLKYLTSTFNIVRTSDIFVNFQPAKTFINLENGEIIPILNKKYLIEDDESVLVIKIDKRSALEEDSLVYITKSSFTGIFQTIRLFSTATVDINKLKSANFSSKRLPEYTSEHDAVDQQDIKIGYSGVDYRYFKNFIRFSSAKDRIDIYKLKQLDITSLLSDLDLCLPESDEYTRIESEINSIRSSFDEYEKFLSTNDQWFSVHDEIGSSGITLAEEYDKSNPDSLINASPANVVQSEDNSDYVKFLSMIGHMFDEIYIKISNFPSIVKPAPTEDIVLPNELLYQVLESNGWKLSDACVVKNKYYTNSLWNRFLSEHPFVYKMKGTKNSIDSLISCYGIPDDILSIKEYSSDMNKAARVHKSSVHSFSPSIIQSDEFIELSSSVGLLNTLQFKFTPFENTHSNGTITRIVHTDNWAFGIVKKNSVYATPFFTLQDDYSEIKTMFLSDIPLFNGGMTNVVIKKIIASDNESTPVEIAVSLDKISYGELTHRSTGSIFVSGSFLSAFVTGSHNIKVGNYSASATDQFSGLIDDIKLWSLPLSENDIFSQHMSIGNYSTEQISTVVNGLELMVNFKSPIDLYDSSSVKFIKTVLEPSRSIAGCNFHNFRTGSLRGYVEPTTNVSSSTYYPYQFSKNNVVQYIYTPNVATEAPNSSKITSDISQQKIQLSPNRSDLQLNQTDAVRKLGVTIQQTDNHEELLRVTSNIDFSDIFGDPSNIFSNVYTGLESFKRTYKRYLPKIKNVNVFTNHIKNYIDPDLFEEIKQLVPVRSNLVTGILIEGDILEKNKYKSIPIVIDSQKKMDDVVIISPDISSPNYISAPIATIDPKTGGVSNNKSVTRYRMENQSDVYAYGEKTSYSPLGGHYSIDGEDYYIDSYKYTEPFVELDGSSGTRTYVKKNVIPFPPIYSINFSGTLEGYFSGSFFDRGDGTYSIAGIFSGSIGSGSATSYSRVINTLTVSGSYSGMPPVSDHISSDMSSFNGIFVTQSDFYRWSERNIIGTVMNDIRKTEKIEKYNKIEKNTPYTGRSSIHNRIIKNIANRNMQSVDTTINEKNGLLDQSLPFESITVDSGRVVVSNQGNGNVLNVVN